MFVVCFNCPYLTWLKPFFVTFVEGLFAFELVPVKIGLGYAKDVEGLVGNEVPKAFLADLVWVNIEPSKILHTDPELACVFGTDGIAETSHFLTLLLQCNPPSSLLVRPPVTHPPAMLVVGTLTVSINWLQETLPGLPLPGLPSMMGQAQCLVVYLYPFPRLRLDVYP